MKSSIRDNNINKCLDYKSNEGFTTNSNCNVRY